MKHTIPNVRWNLKEAPVLRPLPTRDLGLVSPPVKVTRGQQHISRLEIPVDDTVVVEEGQGPG